MRVQRLQQRRGEAVPPERFADPLLVQRHLFHHAAEAGGDDQTLALPESESDHRLMQVHHGLFAGEQDAVGHPEDVRGQCHVPFHHGRKFVDPAVGIFGDIHGLCGDGGKHLQVLGPQTQLLVDRGRQPRCVGIQGGEEFLQCGHGQPLGVMVSSRLRGNQGEPAARQAMVTPMRFNLSTRICGVNGFITNSSTPDMRARAILDGSVSEVTMTTFSVW